MAYTTFDADVAGKMAAMDSSFSGHIPAHFERNKTLKDAWISGYNGMATAMDQRIYSPDMFKPAARKPRAPKVEALETPEQPKAPQPPPQFDSMKAALEAQLQLAK